VAAAVGPTGADGVGTGAAEPEAADVAAKCLARTAPGWPSDGTRAGGTGRVCGMACGTVDSPGGCADGTNGGRNDGTGLDSVALAGIAWAAAGGGAQCPGTGVGVVDTGAIGVKGATGVAAAGAT
jgi:hypothetical protein